MNRFLPAIACLPSLLSAAPPETSAHEARFSLSGVPGNLNATRGEVSRNTETPHKADILFHATWWTWRATEIRFTPEEDGEVELTLSGPWEDSGNGKPARFEIHWDDLSATGATLANGGFEEYADKHPQHWELSWGGDYPSSADWPLADATARTGTTFATTWHDRPLTQKLKVSAGKPVTLTLHARAAIPPGFTPPKRLPSDTPAHHAHAKLKRGMNLGNCWEAPPPYQWGVRFTPEDIDAIAAEGFDHIRVPVAWHYYLKQGEDQKLEINPTLLADLEPVLRRALEKKMHILLDWHHFDDLTTNPAVHRGRFIEGWKCVAEHFKSWPQELFLELLNEPRDALTTSIANELHAEAIAAIRGIDARRTLILSPGKWGEIRELDLLRIPDDDDRIIVTVHCYEPFTFTHQRAHWLQMGNVRDIVFPGPPASPIPQPDTPKEFVRSFIHGYNTLPAEENPSSSKKLRELLDHAHEWSKRFGRPVHLGEFGSHHVADTASRIRYTRDARMLAEERGIPWTLWDWKGAFSYLDKKQGHPLLREALFGP